MSEVTTDKMIICENLVKIYKTKDIEVLALQGLDLEVDTGELMAIIGNSGSGKSTLLNMLGGLDKPSAGRLLINGKDLAKMNEQAMNDYKKSTVGFVWQNNARNLIPYLTARENVELPMILTNQAERRKKAVELLDMVGLSHRENNKLEQLSGGEQQRVAIAIALSNNPKLLLADEPTGSVDTKTSDMILDIFRELNKSLNLTIVIVTHDVLLSRKVDRVVAIRDGRTSSEILRKKSYTDALNDMKLGIIDDNDTHVELAVLDKTGRVQIPKDYLISLGIKEKSKIKVELEEGRIVLIPPEDLNVVNK
jgi:ABC-type lipoprotein export system ATPase subunit